MKPQDTYRIRFSHGCREGEILTLAPGETTLGRSLLNTIMLTDIMVSRLHASFRVSGPSVSITDQNSRGGTFVNGRRIHGPVNLHRGDRIVLGRQVMDVLPASASSQEDETSRAPAPCPARPPKPRPRGARIWATTLLGFVIVSVLLLIRSLYVFVDEAYTSRLGAAGQLAPAGWVVDSRYVDMDEHGATNEMVLVLKPDFKMSSKKRTGVGSIQPEASGQSGP